MSSRRELPYFNKRMLRSYVKSRHQLGHTNGIRHAKIGNQLTCSTPTTVTTPNSIPAVVRNAPVHGPTQDAVRPNCAAQPGRGLSLLGKGHARSFTELSPQHSKVSWMRRMAAASWEVQRCCQRVERRHCRAAEGTISEKKDVPRAMVAINCRTWRAGGRRCCCVGREDWFGDVRGRMLK